MKAVSLLFLAGLLTVANAQADVPDFPGCSSLLPETTVKMELSGTRIKVSGDSRWRYGTFRVTNLGAEPIELTGEKNKNAFEVEEPYSSEVIKVDDGWRGTNGIPGSFLQPPDKFLIPPHGIRSFETPIEPNLPAWDSSTTFYIVIHTLGHRTCMLSTGFTLPPRAITERMALDEKGKVNAEVCPAKVFDQDVVIRFIKKQKFDFGPFADSGPEDLGVMEIENHRRAPIILHGERHGDYFYIPDSRVLVQQHLDSGVWKTRDPMLPATIRYPLDTLTVPAGGKASFVADVQAGALYPGWDRTDRAVLADPEAKVCAASQGIYEAPDPNCNCSSSKY